MKPVLVLISLLLCCPLCAQHDPGRDATRLMVRGELAAATEEVAKTPAPLNSPISKGERHFVLAMIECAKGDADAAFTHAKLAVAAGIAPERFLAGPREVLKPLYAHPGFQQWIARVPLLHGPMVGNVTDHSLDVWVRTDAVRAVTVRVHPVAADGLRQDARVVSASATTAAASDFTATVAIDGLEPDHDYSYDLEIDGKVVSSNQRVRTHPAAGKPARFTVAFGGGAGFTPANERMWKTVASQQPRALLLLGDNVYIDDPEHQVSQQYGYYRRQSQPDWRALVATTGVYTIYDDHDFGENDCAPGPDVDTPPWKRSVWQTFRNNWVNPGYGGGDAQPGCWYDFHIADVHFIAIDTRYYRDLKGGSMLGPVQKKWLLDTLAASKGTFKVIVSSVPWAPGVKKGSKDTWDGFPAERDEIFSFIDEHRIGGVVLMSADRHRSDLRRIPRASGYDLYEMMSSRLTNTHVHPLVKNAQGSEFIIGYNADCSFGRVEIDTTAADPTLTFSIVNIDNEEVGTRVIKLSELGGRSGR